MCFFSSSKCLGRWSKFAFDIFFVSGCQLPYDLETKKMGHEMKYGNFKFDLKFNRIFKKREINLGHIFSNPHVFFPNSEFQKKRLREKFSFSEVCEVHRAYRTLSGLLFVPHALLCRQGGLVVSGECWWINSPNKPGVKHRWNRKKKNGRFFSNPKQGGEGWIRKKRRCKELFTRGARKLSIFSWSFSIHLLLKLQGHNAMPIFPSPME